MKNAAGQGEDGGDHRYDERVLHPFGERGVLEQVEIVLQGESLDPEGVEFHVEEVVRRLEGDDAHPVEGEEQEDQIRTPAAGRCSTSGCSVFTSDHLYSSLRRYDKQQDGEDRQNGEHVEGDRRPHADLRRRQADLVGIGAEDMRLVGRPALGQDVDQLEIGEGPDDGEQGGDQDHPLDVRDRHVAEPVPAFAPSMAAASCSSWGTAWSPARIVMPKNGMPRQMLARQTEEIARLGISQEIDVRLDQPQVSKKPGDGAEHRIEDHEPAESGKGGGHDPGHHHCRPDRVAEAHAVVQDHRQPQSQHRLERDGHHGVDRTCSARSAGRWCR